MRDLLWFVLNGKRLLLIDKKRVHIFDAENWNLLLTIKGSFIGLSEDETLIIVVEDYSKPSIWDIKTGLRVSYEEELTKSFSEHQKVLLKYNHVESEQTLLDVFTRKMLFQLNPPQIAKSDTFARFQFHFPKKPYIFLSTFVDTGWGESHYIWCYDMISNEWLFNSFVAINSIPLVFMSPYEEFAIVKNGNFLSGYELYKEDEVFNHSTSENITALAFHPKNPDEMLIAEARGIFSMSRTTGFKNNFTPQPDIVSLSIHPNEDMFCTLIKSERDVTLGIRETSSCRLVKVIPFDYYSLS